MRAIIVGDSYAKTFHNTWIEYIFNEFKFDLIHHQGVDGGCEFYIYENFRRVLKSHEIDLAIFVHTEPGRLPNFRRFGITPMVTQINDASSLGLPKEAHDAARGYYEQLFYKPYHTWVHHSLIKEMQQICLEKNIKQVHIPAFHYPDTPMTRGLWINGGLFFLTRLDGDFVPGTTDPRKNHLTENMHIKFYKWLTPHLKYYLENKKSEDLHIVLMDPDEVNRCK